MKGYNPLYEWVGNEKEEIFDLKDVVSIGQPNNSEYFIKKTFANDTKYLNIIDNKLTFDATPRPIINMNGTIIIMILIYLQKQ